MKKDFTVVLNEQDANLILSGLGQLPYIKSAPLIDKIIKADIEVNGLPKTTQND